MQLRQRMGDRHQDGRRGAVAADVGDEHAVAPVGLPEEIIVVAAGSLTGFIVNGDV